MAGAEPFVNAKLEQRKVLLFTKRYCPDSKVAVAILDEYNLPRYSYEVVEIERRQDCTQIENYFQILCLTDSRSVPQLFVNGKSIGGWREIPRLHEEGKLKDILQQ
ncbi:glutaredoxin-C8-like [Gigantopelta aegis]|uniref:glutaredoxin-C8-like n=1 Tax=Gigantopelta aegis TaxID=1735272 RepID=UPI001B88DC04|nr:glutaredoxin-C8-like [Gigantopelta aegis]